ncbi:hypothetical protein M0802_009073 [Mischocyttarus mexicanus]|nr:hypothetical protein M0802_009073 [Mischocyttarus mexicanus]
MTTSLDTRIRYLEYEIIDIYNEIDSLKTTIESRHYIFFKSILPYLMCLSEEELLLVQSSILNIINEVINPVSSDSKSNIANSSTNDNDSSSSKTSSLKSKRNVKHSEIF